VLTIAAIITLGIGARGSVGSSGCSPETANGNVLEVGLISEMVADLL
jgi:hypothetical protein